VQHASPVWNPFLHTSDLPALGNTTREPIWDSAANGMFFGNVEGFQHEEIPSNAWAANQWTMRASPLNLTGQMPQPPGVIHASYPYAEQGALPVDEGILGLETVDSETRNSSAALVRSKPTKGLSKPRLRCIHPGCKLTFPRNYELERHLKNIHNRRNIYCPVYGCNRGTKPFARFDKLREHFRKHNTPGQLLCLFDGCDFGPATLTQIKDHLASQQHEHYSKQPHVIDVLALLGIYGGTDLLELPKRREEGRDSCPLSRIGCTFYLSADKPNLWAHVRSHDMFDRSTCYDDIRKILGANQFWGDGLVSCPICNKILSPPHGFDGVWLLESHLWTEHTPSERSQHALVISRLLAPYLTGKEFAWDVVRSLDKELGLTALLPSADSLGTESANRSMILDSSTIKSTG
jgi:hypothetical protein